MGRWKILQPQPETLVNLMPDPIGIAHNSTILFANTNMLGGGSTFESVSDLYSFSGGAAIRAQNAYGYHRIDFHANATALGGRPKLYAGVTYTIVVHTLMNYAPYKYTNLRLSMLRTSVAVPASTSNYPLWVDITAGHTQEKWKRSEVLFTPAVTDTYVMSLVGQSADVADFIPNFSWCFYANAIMIIRGNRVGQGISYFDGDKPGCYWEGAAQASNSVNPKGNTEYGIWADLEELTGAVVQGQENGGIPSTTNDILRPAQGSVGHFVNTTLESRSLNISLWINGDDGIDSLLSKRRKLAALFPPGVERIVGYQAEDDLVTTKVTYAGGMEFTKPNGFAQQIRLTLSAADPYWYSHERDVGAVLYALSGSSSTVTVRRRLQNGIWENMGGITGKVNYIHIEQRTGKVYVGGNFTTDPSTGVTLNRIAVWNNETSAWEAMGSGLSAEVYDIQSFGLPFVATASGIYSWNGTAWTLNNAQVRKALAYTIKDPLHLTGQPEIDLYGTATGAILASDYYYELGSGNTVGFVGGTFTGISAGGSSANRVLMTVNGSSFNAMSPGLDNTVYGIAIDSRREYVYCVGIFNGTVGGTIVSPGIIRWKIATKTWEAVGKGVTPAALRTVSGNGNNQVMYAGQWSRDTNNYVGDFYYGGATSGEITHVGDVYGGVTNTLDLSLNPNAQPLSIAVDDSSNMYLALDVVNASYTLVNSGAITEVNSTALAETDCTLRVYPNTRPIRLENLSNNTTTVFGFSSENGSLLAPVDIEMKSGNGYFAGRWKRFVAGLVIRGSSVQGMQIAPGATRYRMFGIPNSNFKSGVQAPSVLRGRRRHTSIDGGAK